MKHKLLIGLILLLLCAAVVFYWGRQPALLPHHLRASNVDLFEPPDLTDAKTGEIVGPASQQLLLRASSRLKSWPPLKANIRHRIELFGEQIVGPGQYVQAGEGSSKARLELNFRAGDFESQVTQINDGRYLYIKNDSDKDAPNQRIDLSQLADSQQNENSPVASTARWMAMGGLAYLLEQLAADFDFQEARKDQLDSIEVLKLVGKWKAQRIAEICGNLKILDKTGSIRFDQLPEQLPTHVQITLANEEPLRLFPYQIIYLRQNSDSAGNVTKTPIATFEFFDVQPIAALDPATFYIEKDATRLTDITETVLKTIGDNTKQR